MAAATHVEIQSFISKFALLSSCGYETNLNFTTVNGIVKVNFQASLGSLNTSIRNDKPSKIRRRQRRRENRVNSRNTTLTENGSSCNETSVLVQAVTNGVDIHSNLTSSRSSIHQEVTYPCEGSDSSTDHCQTDAAVQAVITVQDSACETDSELYASQVQPFQYPLYNNRNIQPTSFPSAQSDAPHCSYCEKEFANWKDFLEHVKNFSYMCNNCLDYFPDKPWFLTSELVMIDVGKGDRLYPNVPHMTLPQPYL